MTKPLVLISFLLCTEICAGAFATDGHSERKMADTTSFEIGDSRHIGFRFVRRR